MKLEKVASTEEKNLSVDEEPILAELGDYLNFFEFISFLEKIKAVTKSDIDDLFEYYLKLLGKSRIIRAYIKDQGYELLTLSLDKRFGIQRTT